MGSWLWVFFLVVVQFFVSFSLLLLLLVDNLFDIDRSFIKVTANHWLKWMPEPKRQRAKNNIALNKRTKSNATILNNISRKNLHNRALKNCYTMCVYAKCEKELNEKKTHIHSLRIICQSKTFTIRQNTMYEFAFIVVVDNCFFAHR